MVFIIVGTATVTVTVTVTVTALKFHYHCYFKCLLLNGVCLQVLKTYYHPRMYTPIPGMIVVDGGFKYVRRYSIWESAIQNGMRESPN